MRTKVSFIFSLLPVFVALAGLITQPLVAAEGARRGLKLCAVSIVPALLPFFVLSGLLNALAFPAWLARMLRRPMWRWFRLPGSAAIALVLGFVGGYPVGAATLAQLRQSGAIGPREAERLLPFCNNTGPAFIIGAVGAGVFASGRIGLLLYLSHILAALLLGFLSKPRTGALPAPPAKAPPLSTPTLPQALPTAVKQAAVSTLYICAFVVFFSVITALLDHSGLLRWLALWLTAVLGWELRFSLAALTGFLELGGGIGAMAGLSPQAENLALASFLLGFGSLSVHCQTLAAVEEANIKCARHFAGRIVHGSLSACITYFLFRLLQS